ncbi:Wzz/FepE/Etk N-terminal domain-containing protein [Campylobacter concisus]|uniref:Wzz/FepE/Etk N-terminal domain-containing protein n=1 Tax=Campylobacter concisus TaxID=199 RepID=UPI000CD8CDBD|nr:Wzz/FepE/Etk N-terminal domain-containing protein [Campylobacter concisus]
MNQVDISKNGEVDLFELSKKIWNYKKQICMITGIFTLLAVIYAFISTTLYKATALVETGYYKNDNGEEILIANTADNVQKLTIKYIDLLKDVEGLDYKVEKISEVKNNKKFFDIEVVAKSNDTAVKQINKMVEDLASEHQNAINAYIELKKVQLANIERQINFLKNNVIVEKQQQIEYIKSTQIPRMDRQIAYMKDATIPAARREISAIDDISIPSVRKNIELNTQRLKKYEAELEKLRTNKNMGASENIILRQMMEQGLYNQISNLEQSIIAFEQQKQVLLTKSKPDAQNRLDRLVSVELENMQAEKDILVNDKLPSLQRELVNLQTEELNKLLDQRSLVELALKPYNHQNTQIVSDIVISNNPVKPKKTIIIAIAFLSSLMLSVFGVLVYDAIRDRVNKDKREG